MTLDTEAEIKAVWSRGSYSAVASNYLPMAGRLVERAGVTAEDRVLDIGCGTGSVAIAAARRGADVSGLDITPAMLEDAAENAAIAGVDSIDWHEGTATDLPFDDDTFDVTLSSLGHMYGDPPEAAARGLARVTRPGGEIGFTSWTPTSVYPALAGVVSARLSADDLPDFSEPPFMWGDPETVRQRLGSDVDDLSFRTETADYLTLSPAHFCQELRTHSGMFRTFLDKVEDTSGLHDEMVRTVEPYFDPTRNAVELEYLLTTATVKR